MLRRCFPDRRRLHQIRPRSFTEGFVGYKGLSQPDDFVKVAKGAIERTDGLISKMDQVSIGPDVVGALDEISDSICSVADVANFCNCVHSNERWRTEARRASQILMNYISNLNTNLDLFNALKSSLDKQQQQQLPMDDYWSEEALVVGQSLFRDFQNSGIGRPNRQEIVELIAMEHQLGNKFQICVARHSEVKALSLKDARLVPSHLETFGVHHLGHFHLPMTPSIYHNITHTVDEEWIRKEAYLAHFSSLKENVKTLEELLEVRRNWANALGWNSFLEFKLQDSIVVNPNSVKSFLHNIAEDSRSGALEEIQDLKKLKGSEIQPWDLSYYMNKAKRQRLKDLGFHHPIEFQLDSIINGLRRFLAEFMDIEMILNLDVSLLWSKSVQQYTFKHLTRKIKIGELYLDLFSRKDKVPENAHYTLRCGRLLNDGRYQTPVVALVTNFTSSTISFYELKTLLHEFGHVLHSLLSRTHFQHLFGTRGPLDLVEIPSHFFENFSQSPQALQYLLGVDDKTKKLTPIETLKNAVEVNSMFQNLRILDQIQIAMIDHKLHNLDFHTLDQTSAEIVEDVTQEFGVLPYIKDTNREAWLTHLVSYGGRYYSYIYSRHVGNLAWSRNIESNIFDRQSWKSIQNRLFKPGGAMNPQDYVKSLIGQENLNKDKSNGWIPSMQGSFRSF